MTLPPTPKALSIIAVSVTVALTACSADPVVSRAATPFVIAPPNVCPNGDPKHPFFARRGWGYCPNAAVRA